MTADERVQRDLRDLAQHMPPIGGRPPSDLATAVLVRIRDDATAGAPSRRSRTATLIAAALCATLVAAYGLVSPVRDATASVLRLVGIDIRSAGEGATPPDPSPPTRADLGRRVAVEGISTTAGFAVPMPDALSLGEPDEAYLIDGGAYQIVTLVWRERSGIPVAPASDASVLLSVFHGAPPDEEFVLKVLYSGARARSVSVHGQVGAFVSGPQTVMYAASNGDVLDGAARLSANSLIWQQDGVTLRLESALGRDASVAIAESTH
jgi:hypothetical protein